MLLDSLIPHPDFTERHEIEIAAEPPVVYRALHEADLGGHPLIRSLLALRSLPALLGDPAARRRGRAPITLSAIREGGFELLAEDPGREIVLGVVGRFWRLTGNIDRFDPASFAQPLASGRAKAAWSFAVVPAGTGTSLTTETRIVCADVASRRRFRLYWLVVRPFSGLIRILMLRAVRDQCLAGRE